MERRLLHALGHSVVIAGLAASVGACAYLESGGGSAATQTRSANATQGILADIRSSDSVETLIRYGVLLHSIPAEALQREYEQVSGAMANDPSVPERIRLALLLSLPGAAFQDNARARRHLDKALDDTGYHARQYHDFARFLVTMLDDRKALEGQLSDERRQRQELQQKLDQLKAIEQDTGARIQPKPIKEH